MNSPFDVLRMKEHELLKVRREVGALRIAAGLLSDSVSLPRGTQEEGTSTLDPDVLQALLDSINET